MAVNSWRIKASHIGLRMMLPEQTNRNERTRARFSGPFLFRRPSASSVLIFKYKGRSKRLYFRYWATSWSTRLGSRNLMIFLAVWTPRDCERAAWGGFLGPD